MAKALIIGGGITGIQAALNLSQLGIENILLEREKTLGGNLRNLGTTFPRGEHASEIIEARLREMQSLRMTTIFTEAELIAMSGHHPRFTVSFTTPQGEKRAEVGSIIVATGFTPFDPRKLKQYGAGKYEDVITALDLARMIKEGKVMRNSTGQKPSSISFIQCIGSRDLHTHTFCSYFCCMYAVHLALQIKTLYPDCNVHVLYMDLRTPFSSELIYEEARARGVTFYRSKPARIQKAQGDSPLTIQFEDTLDTTLRFLSTEIVVLSIGASPPEGTASLASLLHITCEESGFYNIERAPVYTNKRGVLLAGAASGPKDISSCIAEGAAAAASVAMELKG